MTTLHHNIKAEGSSLAVPECKIVDQMTTMTRSELDLHHRIVQDGEEELGLDGTMILETVSTRRS